MLSQNDHIPETTGEFLGDETLTEALPVCPSEGEHSGLGRDELQANYEALVREKAIFYPVAYRFLRELGRGRQGVVFLGLRQGARGCLTRHAVKMFDPSIYPAAREYWTDMGRIAHQISELQSVHSPNLVGRDIYEEVNGVGYIQMDAVDGMDLRRFLNGQHLQRAIKNSTDEEWARFTDVIFRLDDGRVTIQPGVALNIMRQVLRGIEALHVRGFIHSDVKPGNIMINRSGFAQVVDFGRAVRVDERVRFLLGSPMYMAPETHRREPSSPQSDLFGAGLVAIELLRGGPFIDAHSMSESDVLEHKLKLKDNLHKLLPAHVQQNHELVDMLRRFVEPNPEDRFPSAMAAESDQGLRLVHRQLTHLGKDTQYDRELQLYMSKLVDPATDRIEWSGGPGPSLT
jgi:serine/threonine-protein kinase